MTRTTHLTLSLPFALPPPEMAPDLVRAVQSQLPALSALLARHGRLDFAPAGADSRVLPHEVWLAGMLASVPSRSSTEAASAAGSGEVPFAVRAMRGCGLDPGDGYWLMLQPAHIQISRTHLLMSDPRQLRLAPEHGRALFELAKPYFDDVGRTLLYGGPDLWFVRADDWRALRTASPDAAIAQNVNDWLPDGDRSGEMALRRLQNEIQMLWHEHPVNEARQVQGLAVINAFWVWGGAAAGATSAAIHPPLWVAAGPDWMMTLADPARRAPTAGASLTDAASQGSAAVLLANLAAPALSGDWSDWIARMQQLEQDWFAPLLAALHDGTLGRLTLVLSHRHATLTVTTSKLAQHKFWRKPGLQALLAQPATTPHLQNA